MFLKESKVSVHVKLPIFIGTWYYCWLQLSFGNYQADEQAWIDTIKSVGTRETVRINTMDWLGQSQFTDETIYWSSLSSAISEVTSSVIAFLPFQTPQPYTLLSLSQDNWRFKNKSPKISVILFFDESKIVLFQCYSK